MKTNQNIESLQHNIHPVTFYYGLSGLSNNKQWSVSTWSGRNERFINEEQINIYNDIIEKIKHSTNKITSKDIIYTGCLSDVPRFKLKEYINENKIKRTSRIEQSTCIIISRKIFDEVSIIFKVKDYTFINENLAKDINNSINWENQNINPFPSAFDKNQFYYFPHDKSSLLTSKKWGSKFTNNSYDVKGCIIDLYRNNKLITFTELIIFLHNNPTIKIVFDEVLFESLNQEGIELDNDYESTLRDMIFSQDPSNVKLGVEMISNLVINDYTILKISLLLNEFVQNRKLTELTAYSQSNRNFKTILNILKTKKIFWIAEWKTFAAGLRKNFNKGIEGEAVKLFIINNLNKEFNKQVDGFKIEDIKFGV
jgi:hypothetical protein